MAVAVAAGTVNAAPEIRGPLTRPVEGLRSANLGASSAAVFAMPSVTSIYRGIEVAALPEYRRNNRHLSDRPVEPLTALDAWPTRPVPDISRRRTTTILRNDRSFLFFLPARRSTSSFRGF